MYENNDTPRVLVSYLTLRRIVGTLGVLLPVVLAVGCFALGLCTVLQNSISEYYGTGMRDVLVGVLFAIAWFLFSYRGYDRKDDLAGDLAGLFALGVALFPATSGSRGTQVVHFASATALFVVLAYFSFFLFTKTKEGGNATPAKKKRNMVYRVCGVTIVAGSTRGSTWSVVCTRLLPTR